MTQIQDTDSHNNTLHKVYVKDTPQLAIKLVALSRLLNGRSVKNAGTTSFIKARNCKNRFVWLSTFPWSLHHTRKYNQVPA